MIHMLPIDNVTCRYLFMSLTDPGVQSALIAAVVTLTVLVLRALAKPIWERNFHRFKLESDYRYDQRKKLERLSRSIKFHC